MLIKFPLLRSSNRLCHGLVPASSSAYVPAQVTKRQQSMPKAIANSIVTYLADQGMPSQYIHGYIYFGKMKQQLYYYLKNKGEAYNHSLDVERLSLSGNPSPSQETLQHSFSKSNE